MSKTSTKDMEKLAFQLFRYLKNKGLAGDIRIYFKGGRCISDHESYNPRVHFTKKVHTFHGKEFEYWDCDDEIKGSEYFEWSNDETLSVSTEGGLYGVLNYYVGGIDYCDRIHKELNEMFGKYGLYFEQGNDWNFSLYEI